MRTDAAIGGNALLAISSGFYKDSKTIPKSYYRHVYLTAVRTLTRRTSVRQQQYVSPSLLP
jgi:hypothetical protein